MGSCFVFSSCEEAVKGMKDAVANYGRTYQTSSISGQKTTCFCREVIGFSGRLTGWSDRENVRSILGEKNYNFLKQEFKEWLTPGLPTNPGRAWEEDPEVWAKFRREDGSFQYTYGDRFKVGNQFETAVEALVSDPRTRQAFISIWSPEKDAPQIPISGPNGRIPCTIGYHFMIRPDDQGLDHLEMVYFMRSLNTNWNLWNDLYLVSNLFDFMLERLKARIETSLSPSGVIHLNVGSLHFFPEEGK